MNRLRLMYPVLDMQLPTSRIQRTVLSRNHPERRYDKSGIWTNQNSGNPPWEVRWVDAGNKPAVVTFFSFKGGVGRTTALVATALTLARNGHRVAIVDLDLEAPGLSTVFSQENLVQYGVIDYLLEKKIQDRNWSLRNDILQI
ncbi:MAG: KGGVGR-motif variant AAA ATPase, partial [Dolichospermum sp.]